MSKLLATFAVAVLFGVTASAQYKAPHFTPQQGQFKQLIPNSPSKVDGIVNNKLLPEAELKESKSLPDSIQVLAARKASSVSDKSLETKKLPYGADLKTNLVIDDGTRLYSSITWYGGDFSGVAKFRLTDGTYPESVNKSVSFGNAAYDGKYIYDKTYSAAGGQVYQCDYYVYDASTWNTVRHVALNQQWYETDDMLAYNPHDGKVWAIARDGFRRPFIANIDTLTGSNVFIGQTPFTGDLAAMAFDNNGTLYGLNNSGDLVTVDLTTGETTKIGKTIDGSGWGKSLTFDRHTGELYLTDLTNDWASKIYRVNIKTGEVTLVAQLPNSLQLNGVYIVSPTAPAKAPNTVAAIKTKFGANGSTAGTISITAPATAFDGSPLNGDVTMKLYVDSTLTETRSQQAGSTIEINHDFGTEGEHWVQVTYSNAAGTSPTGTIKPFCGIDTPWDVSDLKMTTDDQTGVTNVTWSPVTRGIHDGYLDLSDITYTVVRMPDSVTVAKNIKETSFTETLSKETEAKSQYYRVFASSNGIDGDAVASNAVVFGKSLETPVDTYLGNDDFNALMMTENKDGHGDGFYGGWSVLFVNAGYSDTSFVNNKWAYTPAIHLKKGNYYYQVQHDGHGYGLYFGKYRNEESQKQNLIGRIDQDITSDDYYTAEDNEYNDAGFSQYITYKKLITIPEEGDYYFGINWDIKYNAGDVSASAKMRHFVVKEGPEFTAPQECVLDSAKTQPLGELNNNIWFTTPSKDYQGNTLSNISKVEFYLSTDETVNGRIQHVNKLVYTLENVEPGKGYKVTVPAHQGRNLYYFYAYNENGRGGEREVSIWAGNDLPTTVTNPQYEVIDNRDIHFTWDAPSVLGQHGGYVNPDDVLYNAGAAESTSSGLVTIAADLKAKEYTFIGENGPQYQYYYGVTPHNSLGEGIGVMAPITVGTPYSIPFVESFNFSSGSFKTQAWGLLLAQGVHSWSAYGASPTGNITPSDNDGGMLLFYHRNDTLSAEALQTPVYEISGAKKPTLSFKFWNNPNANDVYAGMTVYAMVNDVMVQKPLASIPLNNGGEEGWKQYEIPLDDYDGENRVYFYFVGSNSKSSSILGLDDIELYDNIPVDISVDSIIPPARVTPNEENTFTVEVLGRGRNSINSYSVELLADGEKIAEAEGSNLAFNQTAELKLSFRPEPKTYGKSVTYTLRAVAADDGNEDNDSKTSTLTVGNTALPMPRNAALNDGTLSWSAPETPEWTQVRENFEDYDPFIIDNIGEWGVYDGDKQLSMAPNDGHGYAADFANNWCAKSWQVWNPTGLTLISQLGGNAMKIYGNQCLISFDAQGYMPDLTAAADNKTDDWFISPRIAGGTKLAFAAKRTPNNVNEKFEVLVSYATSQPEDFSAIATDSLTNSSIKRFEYTLPEDARYFAIRNITSGGFCMMIDNIDYTPGYTDLELIGYNVYGDGVLLNKEPLSAGQLSYVVNNSNAGIYGITAVYDYDGESAMATVVATGIANIASTSLNVTSVDGKLSVRGAKGKAVSVYTTAGQLVDAFTPATDELSLALKPAVYLVKIGNKAFKVVLK